MDNGITRRKEFSSKFLSRLVPSRRYRRTLLTVELRSLFTAETRLSLVDVEGGVSLTDVLIGKL